MGHGPASQIGKPAFFRGIAQRYQRGTPVCTALRYTWRPVWNFRGPRVFTLEVAAGSAMECAVHRIYSLIGGIFMTKLGIIPSIALSFSLLAFSGAASALEVGDKAPNFELASTQGGKFKLSDQAGKKNVIVQFYVLDFTPT